MKRIKGVMSGSIIPECMSGRRVARFIEPSRLKNYNLHMVVRCDFPICRMTRSGIDTFLKGN